VLLNIKTFVSSINQSWLNFKLQTQLIFATTAVLLILLSSVTSWSLSSLQNLPSSNVNRFANDINSLLRDNIVFLIEEQKSNEIIPFCERFYKNSTSLRYIIFIDSKGITYGIPYNYNEIFSQYDVLNLLDRVKNSSLPFNLLKNFEATTLTVMVLANEKFLGLLLLGNNSTIPLSNNILIKNQLIFAVFIIFFIVIVLGTLFVRVTIIRPLNEISHGLANIAAGNFSKRLNLRFGGELGDLIASFNELGRRLQVYEEKNREQLFSEKIKLESLITTLTDGALLLDTNLRIVLVNTTAIKIFGWRTKTRLIGTPIWDHLPIGLQKKLFVTLQDILFDTQSAIFDGTIEDNLVQFSNRSIRIILNVVYDSSDKNKIPIGIGMTVQDMTKAFELDKTQNRFMSNISHELRTPLFNIKSFIETIQEYDYSLSLGQRRYFLDIVSKETNRLTRLVNDILCLSKLNSLKAVPLGSMNLVETINQTTANYQLIARDKNLYLHSELFKPTLTIQGNKDLLLQVIINLVGNALKFTYNEGEIVVRAYKMKNQLVRVEIVDTGVGILYGYQQYIFQRFYRIENEVHTLKGTGLGLSIVDTILSEHKTEINVVSRYSVGSTFWFDLCLD
jgi:two-component system sensor histidine kinase NblS